MTGLSKDVRSVTAVGLGNRGDAPAIADGPNSWCILVERFILLDDATIEPCSRVLSNSDEDCHAQRDTTQISAVGFLAQGDSRKCAKLDLLPFVATSQAVLRHVTQADGLARA
jgi:hypothetical protein